MRQYIGPRFVPTYYQNSQDPTSSEWEPNVRYDPLTIVSLPNLHSYQSKKLVPDNIGSPALNPEYWYDQGYAQAYCQALQDQIDDMKDGDVAGSLQNQINDLDSRTDELESGLNNCYVLFDQHTHSFAVTGTNWAEALEALASHILAFIQGVSDDAFIEICDLRLTGLGLSFTIPQHKFYDNSATSVTFPFFGMSASQSSAYIYTGTAWSGTVANNKLVRTWLRDNQYPVSEVVDFTILVPGPSFNFDMRIWKKISIT